MSEWTDPAAAGLLARYRELRAEHGYHRRPRSRWGKPRPRWCDGFALVVDPATGTAYAARHGRPPAQPQQD